jgi:hypothetical protein
MTLSTLARLARVVLPITFAACAPAGPALDCSSCPPPAHALEEWEARILEPTLADLHKGVHPVGDQGFGVCRGTTECESFLGPTPGELPPGDYLIRAELGVPAVGTGWKADFHIDCASPDGSAKAAQTQDRSYDLKYMGPDRGQRLQPLWRIQSPHPSGPRACSYTLSAIRPDGQKGAVISGSYSTPAPVPVPLP